MKMLQLSLPEHPTGEEIMEWSKIFFTALESVWKAGYRAGRDGVSEEGCGIDHRMQDDVKKILEEE